MYRRQPMALRRINKDRPCYILSIDGGGVRGAAAAAFLASLEVKAHRTMQEMFQCFAGTSIGGIIALYLAKGGSGCDASALFDANNLRSIMPKGIANRIPGWKFVRPKYDGKGKTETMQRIFRDARMQDCAPVIVTAYDLVEHKVRLFRSYDVRHGPLYVAEVADITSAAPTYFPPRRMDGGLRPKWMVDGGVAANDPSALALADLIHNGIPLESIWMLSVGTGYPNLNQVDAASDARSSARWGVVKWLKHGLIDDLVRGSDTGINRTARSLLGNRYLRIDSQLGVCSPSIDDTSSDNLAALESLGRQWYHDYDTAISRFMEASSHAPAIQPEPICVDTRESPTFGY